MAIGAAFFEMTARLMSDPSRLVQAQMSLWNDYMRAVAEHDDSLLGGDAAEPVAEPASDDRRFRDQAWSDNALFDFIKQSYLLTARWIAGCGQGGRRARRAHRAQGRFLYEAIRRCAGAVELRIDQSRGVARHDRKPRREPAERAEEPA